MKTHELDGQLTFLILGPSGDGPSKAPVRSRQKDLSELVSIPYFHLDLSPDHVDLFGNHYWALCSPWRETGPPLNTGPAPRKPVRCSLSDILEPDPDPKYYLSRTACLGILRRADQRGKPLPNPLKSALMAQAGFVPSAGNTHGGLPLAFHINQREEAIDLGETSGALMATNNMQMQTFVTGNPIAFTANQRDEVRNLHDVAGTLAAQLGIKQQTFIAGFSAGAGAKAGSIGYSEKISPTLKGTASGNCMPSVLCLNDQGGNMMDCSQDVTGTLRAQEHGHQPLVYENHGIDARYTGPYPVSPTLSARAGTGGNNLPLVANDFYSSLPDKDRHPVFSRQRVDVFKDDEVASTESARQQKDVTGLVYQPKIGPLLIRRLTPLECERLQGFPDGWTDIPGASDSARYKALGNSVAIPCVEFIMRGITMALECTA